MRPGALLGGEVQRGLGTTALGEEMEGKEGEAEVLRGSKQTETAEIKGGAGHCGGKGDEDEETSFSQHPSPQHQTCAELPVTGQLQGRLSG